MLVVDEASLASTEQVRDLLQGRHRHAVAPGRAGR